MVWLDYIESVYLNNDMVVLCWESVYVINGMIILYWECVYLNNGMDHVERKVPNYEYHKIRERKVKTLTRNWKDHCRTGTRKQTEIVSKYFNRHGGPYQSEESNCLQTHDRDGVTREFMKGGTRGLREGWMEGNYLRLMPGLSLEDRTNIKYTSSKNSVS